MQAATAGGYVDFSRFSALRQRAVDDGAGALSKVAEEFEALFVDLMLKAAREAEMEGGLFDSNELGTYREMLDQQLAMSLAEQNDLGIGRLMAEQFAGLVEHADAGAALARHTELVPTASAALRLPLVPGDAERAAATHAATLEAAFGDAAVFPTGAAGTASHKDAFVAALAPHAQAAASTLGVSPRALVAQAALESGWGRHVIRDAAGRSSHNYFGIKAGPAWDGAVVKVPTTEYINGRAVTVHAAFRAYPDAGAAFADYVDFIGGNPRYEDVVANGASARRFAAELAAAGYATDPNYANKIMAILDADDWSGLLGTQPTVSN